MTSQARSPVHSAVLAGELPTSGCSARTAAPTRGWRSTSRLPGRPAGARGHSGRLATHGRRDRTAIGGLTGRLLTGFLTELGSWRLALGGVAALLMGGFVAVYNVGTFRLESAPYSLTPALASLVFLAYLLGSASSPTAGWLADRLGRRLVVPSSVVVMAAGIALTLPGPLWCVVVGLCVLSIGFFAAHGVASGWVAVRAQLGGRAVGQAASLYSFWYYVGSSVGRLVGRSVGSSVGGTLAGGAWQDAGWPGVVVLAGACTAGALLLTLALGRTRSLEPG